MPLVQNKAGKYNAKCDKCGRMLLKGYHAQSTAESALAQHSCKGKGPWTARGPRVGSRGSSLNPAALPPSYSAVPRTRGER